MKSVSLLICICMAAVDEPRMSVAPDEPRTIWDYAAEFGSGSNMSIPRDALQRDNIEQWARLLDASEAQLAFILRKYEQFVDRHNAFLELEAPRYLSLTHELTNIWQAEGLSTPDFVEHVKIVDRANLRMRRELTNLEHSLIDSFAPILTPEQQRRLVILRNESTRRNCRTFHTDGYGRWLDVELRAIWHRSGALLALPAEDQLVNSILDGYEAQLTNLVCGYANLQFQRRTELAQNRVARNHGTITLAESHARYTRIMRARLAASQRIRRLNEATVRQIADILSPQPASQFLQSVKEAAFPELYPDPTSLRGDLRSVLAQDETIHATARDTISGIFDQYKMHYYRICDQLEAICIEWGDKTEEGIAGYESQFLPDALEPLLEERSELSRRYLMKLHDHLGTEVLARHAEAIPAALRSQVEELLQEQ